VDIRQRQHREHDSHHLAENWALALAARTLPHHTGRRVPMIITG
jgi:hypothetical protein